MFSIGRNNTETSEMLTIAALTFALCTVVGVLTSRAAASSPALRLLPRAPHGT